MSTGTTQRADDKTPRTERGRRTLRKLLDASATEFGEKGFHEASVSSITRRAGVALGTFYTYFDSKDALFRALVQDMSDNVKSSARSALRDDMSALEIEEAALAAFLRFAREHKEIYRIIDEAEFVDPASYRAHYETIAERIAGRLAAGGDSGEFRPLHLEYAVYSLIAPMIFLLMWKHSMAPCCPASQQIDPVSFIDSQVNLLLGGMLSPASR